MGRRVGDADVSPCGAMLTAPFCGNDLAFLLHAAADRVGAALDAAARDIGLKDVRDWFVLGALNDGQQRTQLELSRMVCVDKTTLISVLDRLEERGLVVRTAHATDRRVRIPQITDAGRDVLARFTAARDAVQENALRDVTDARRAELLGVLAGIAELSPDLVG